MPKYHQLKKAKKVSLEGNGDFNARGGLKETDPNDFYRIELGDRASLGVDVFGQKGNGADLEVYEFKGNARKALKAIGRVNFDQLKKKDARKYLKTLGRSRSKGTADESLSLELDSGQYYVRVYQRKGKTRYKLNLAANPPENPIGISLDNTQDAPLDFSGATVSEFTGNANTDNIYGFDVDNSKEFYLKLDGLTAGSSVELFQDQNGNNVVDNGEVIDTITSTNDGTILLNSELAPGSYAVRVLPDDSHNADTNYSLKLLTESPHADPITVNVPPTAADTPAGTQDDGSIIDIMVVYTPQARDKEGGAVGINQLIQSSVDEINQGYTNSGINPRLRLVHTAEVSYAESGNSGTDLRALQNKSDGLMDRVHSLRDSYGADLVSLFLGHSDAGSRAFTMSEKPAAWFADWAFSVVETDMARNRKSLGHEIGHNFGAQHNLKDAKREPHYPYGYGYTTPSGAGTIMSYAFDRKNVYSSPNVVLDGEVFGNAATADNVRVFNDVAPIAANWRQSTIPLGSTQPQPPETEVTEGTVTLPAPGSSPPPIAPPLPETEVIGGTVTVPAPGSSPPPMAIPTPKSTVSLSATDAIAAETASNSNPGSFRLTRTGSTSSSLTVSYGVSGSATSTSDYTALPGSVTFAAGASTVDIPITPVNDTVVEDHETVTLTLNSGSAYDLGTAIAATVTITDNDLSPVVSSHINSVTPNGGETLKRGSTTDITWNDNLSGNVKLELYKGNSFVQTIDSSEASDGLFAWQVPTTLTNGHDYRIKISSTADSTVYGWSASNFSISDNGFNIEFDYRFDTNGWFDSTKKAALEAAADLIEAIIEDEFYDVPAGTTLSVRDPQSNTMTQFESASTIDDLRIFVGARDLGGSLGIGGASGYWFSGSQLEERYRGNDFEPWTGSIAFSTTKPWYFDSTPDPSDTIPSGQNDFVSVAVHEIGHILGIGSADAFDNLVGTANGKSYFTGSKTTEKNGGSSLPLTDDARHIAEEYEYNGSGEAALDPDLTVGTRKLYNVFDIAILDDIGYEVNYDSVIVNNTALFTNSGIVLAAIEPTFGTKVTHWADYDGDGDLDFSLAGTNASDTEEALVYNNTGGTFTDNAPFLSYNELVSWSDYDNDGDLDALTTGNPGDPKLYRNTNGSFTWDFNTGLYAGDEGNSISWGDYDNDGDLDFVITAHQGYAAVYRNDSGRFTKTNDSFSIGMGALASWGDYDGDRDLDLLISGFQESAADNLNTKVYRNENGTFVDANAGLESNFSGSAWGDYDNDGDLDILLVGNSGTLLQLGSNRVKIYRNTNGTFSDANVDISLDAISGLGGWADYDNDGDLDILITGSGGSVEPLSIFDNVGGSFVAKPIDTLNAIESRSASWGDYDNDGDLDILASVEINGGSESYSPGTAVILKNNSRVSNTAPTAPTGLSTSVSGSTVTFNWQKATDVQTPQNGLTYNLRIGTTPGGCEIMAPMSTSTGKRMVVEMGNTNHNTSWIIKNLAPGTYYWSVQSVDTGYMGSAFTTEDSFVVDTFTDSGMSLPGVYDVDSTQWGDYDSDGDLDLLLMGSMNDDFDDRDAKLLHNSQANFIEVSSSIIGTRGDFAWGDYDNDGDLDLLVSESILNSKIYRNDSGNFIDINASLNVQMPPGQSYSVYSSQVSWIDYDNDGDLDALIGDVNETKLYRNDAETFVDSGHSLIAAGTGTHSWGDYDGDRDLDLLVVGYKTVRYSDGTEEGEYVTRIYRNDNGVLVDANVSLSKTYGEGAWGDYDNDGDLDIILTGRPENWPDEWSRTLIYRNDNGSFTDIGSDLPSLWNGDGFGGWADYDNDGDLDFLLRGGYSSGGLQPLIYQNDNGSFIDASLQGFDNSDFPWSYSASWGDYDNDGDLDIVASGDSSSYVTKLFTNNSISENTAPLAPSGLSTSVSGSTVTFGWQKATDAQTPQNGLTYNLRVGTTPSGGEIMSPMSTSSGKRMVVEMGNTNHNTGWLLKGLEPGTYYWSVQAVDTGYMGSAFAATQSFTIPGR
ncbi:MAG: FG-GAP-like repeat-containing protein [Leptolyngbyaceae cyanobacterium]